MTNRDSFLDNGSLILIAIARFVRSWVNYRKLNKTIEEIVDKKMKTK